MILYFNNYVLKNSIYYIQFPLSSMSSHCVGVEDTVEDATVDSVETFSVESGFDVVLVVVVVFLIKGQRHDRYRQVRKKPSDSRALEISRRATIAR